MDLGEKKIKVLQFICPSGFYGAERWILALAKYLDPGRVTCHLVVTMESGMAELEVVKQYRQLGEVFTVPMRGRFDIAVVHKLCDLVRNQGYDIIHSHGYKSDILGLIVARMTGIKAISTPHGFENSSDWKLRAYIGLGSRFLRYFDRVAPLSEQLCRDVAKAGVDEFKVAYVRNGVDLEEIEAQRLRKSSNKIFSEKTRKRIGFIGQMISRKNVHDLLDVFDDLKKRFSDLELILLGDGEQRAELEGYAQSLQCHPDVKFLGFRNDRLEWLQSFDLFAMTSTLEGIPRCLMETMAMGVPVAAYDIPGIDQLIVHDETGLLAPLGDKRQLAQHWETLLYDHERANSIAEQARNYVWDKFSGRRMAQEYTQIFADMTG